MNCLSRNFLKDSIRRMNPEQNVIKLVDTSSLFFIANRLRNELWAVSIKNINRWQKINILASITFFPLVSPLTI